MITELMLNMDQPLNYSMEETVSLNHFMEEENSNLAEVSRHKAHQLSQHQDGKLSLRTTDSLFVTRS